MISLNAEHDRNRVFPRSEVHRGYTDISARPLWTYFDGDVVSPKRTSGNSQSSTLNRYSKKTSQHIVRTVRQASPNCFRHPTTISPSKPVSNRQKVDGSGVGFGGGTPPGPPDQPLGSEAADPEKV